MNDTLGRVRSREEGLRLAKAGTSTIDGAGEVEELGGGLEQSSPDHAYGP